MIAKEECFSPSFRRSYQCCFMTTALFFPGHIPQGPGYNSDKAPSSSPLPLSAPTKTLGAPNEIGEHLIKSTFKVEQTYRDFKVSGSSLSHNLSVIKSHNRTERDSPSQAFGIS